MTESVSIKYGNRDVEFFKSPTQIAVRPSVGRARELEFELETLSSRAPVHRSGRLGGFEIMDIRLPEREVMEQAERFDNSLFVDERVQV